METFFNFLAQNTPNIQTRQALVLIELQNEFLAPDGKLQIQGRGEFVAKIETLVNDFRPHGDLIWVRSEFDPNVTHEPRDIDDYNTVVHLEDHSPRQQDDMDEELFLNVTSKSTQLCLKGTLGSCFSSELANIILPHDIRISKNQYSAFSATSLLSTLRSRLVTKLYICGTTSNISVYATALDAARYGIETVLIEDCLGYRHLERHHLAMQRLSSYSVARILTHERALYLLRHPEEDVVEAEDVYEEADVPYEDDMVENLNSLEVDDQATQDEMPLPTALPVRMTFKSTIDARPGGSTVAYVSLIDANSHSAMPRMSAKRSCLATDTKSDCAAQTHGDSLPLRSSTSRRDQSPKRENPHTTAALFTDIGVPQAMTPSQEVQDKQTDQFRAMPLFGDHNTAESAGSTIVYDLLPQELATVAFEQIQAEVQWQRMLHHTGEVPRLVCCQGTIRDDGSVPVYRHPSDRTITALPWTVMVGRIRRIAEQHVGHELNHALIQLYRGGNDFISEHSDKTLDIVPGSTIVNVSLGAERTMRLRSKRAGNTITARTAHRVRLPHNSMVSMTLETNAKFLHGIKADKRPRVELTDAEMAFDGQRISLTFRQIGTFSDWTGALIWGQGAIGEDREHAGQAISGEAVESDKLIMAFGIENQSSSMEWDVWYGVGSNVLHLK